jgi:hypothetical protein
MAIGEGGVNDLPGDPGVILLVAGTAGNGTVGPGDPLDFWRIPVLPGQFLQAEVQGVRRDQAGWDAAGSAPQLTLIGPAPFHALLLDHVPGLWPLGPRDLDIPCTRVGAAGDHYLCVQNGGASPAAYSVQWRILAPLAPVQLETEPPFGGAPPNDAPPDAQPIVPGTVVAHHLDDDVDIFRFVLAAESVVCFEVKAQRTGIAGGSPGYQDPVISIRDLLGGPLLPAVENDDTFNWDSAICRKLPAGTWLLRVEERVGTVAFGQYALEFVRRDVPAGVTEDDAGTPALPNNDTPAEADSNPYGFSARGIASSSDTDFYRFFGSAGDIVRAQWFDASNSSAAAEVVLVFTDAAGVPLPAATPGNLQVQRAILPTTGNHHVRVTGLGAATDYCFHLERFAVSDPESESNDSAATADSLGTARRGSGTIDPPGDLDFWYLDAVAGETVTLAVHAMPGFYDPTEDEFDGYGSTLAPRIVVHDGVGPIPGVVATRTPPSGFGGPSAQSLADGLPTIGLVFVAPVTGRYFVEVGTDPPGGGGATALYAIERR